MKKLLILAALAASPWAYAGGGGQQEPITPMNDEGLYVYSTKQQRTMPESIVVMVSTTNGRRSVLHSPTYLEPGPIAATDGEELEYSDGVEFIESPTPLSDVFPLQRGYYDWHHNRRMGYGYYHWYGYNHPYYPYYRVHYDPLPDVRYYYPRHYYRYRPYHHYHVGDLIYRFFRRILD